MGFVFVTGVVGGMGWVVCTS